MLRIMAVALAAVAAFDWFYLDGKYFHAVELAVLSLYRSW
jgi:hypothetical protein